MNPAEARRGASRVRSRAAALIALTRPHIVLMSLIAAAAGALVDGTQAASLGALLGVAFGVALLVAGAGALNMVIERDADGAMRRTAHRPLVTGEIGARAACGFAAALVAGALGLLAAAGGALTLALGVTGLLLYVAVYTPLKRRSPWAVLPGAIAGAAPPLIGAASRGGPSGEGLLLFGLLVLWQLPHFIAIAVVHREDYARAGFRTAAQRCSPTTLRVLVAALTAALLPVSLLFVQRAGLGWAAAVPIVGACCLLLALSVRARGDGGRDETWGRRYFRASLLYVPALLAGIFLGGG